MAEWILRCLAERKGITDIEVDSAGIYPGGTLSANARDEIMRRCAFDPGDRPAKNITDLDLSDFTRILCMTKSHKEAVLRFTDCSQSGRVQTLAEAIHEEGDIPDPYGGDEKIYSRCALKIENMLEKLLEQLDVS